MKNNVLKYLLTVILQIVFTSGYAYDFKVDGIYYKIISSTDRTCKVTWGTTYINSYSGEIKIPASITYNSTEYSVTEIDSYTFYNCTNLKLIEIPASVNTIKSYAFYNCSSLSSIIDLAVSPQTITSYTFGSTNVPIHVPKGYDYIYNTSSFWNTLTIVGDMINYTLGDVDNNGEVDVNDVNFLANYLISKGKSLYNTYASDINCDEKIDICDLACLISILNGKYNTTDADVNISSGTSVIPSWGTPNEDAGSVADGETEF